MLEIAARVSVRTAEECLPGEDPVIVSQEETAQQEQQGYTKKTPGKGYCVKSEKNPDWSGGCYPSKGEAKERLKQVEKFKHMKGSLSSIISATDEFLRAPSSPSIRFVMSAIQVAEAELAEECLAQQEEIAKAPPGWKKTVEDMKKHEEIDNPFALAWYMKNKGDKPHKKSK